MVVVRRAEAAEVVRRAAGRRVAAVVRAAVPVRRVLRPVVVAVVRLRAAVVEGFRADVVRAAVLLRAVVLFRAVVVLLRAVVLRAVPLRAAAERVVALFRAVVAGLRAEVVDLRPEVDRAVRAVRVAVPVDLRALVRVPVRAPLLALVERAGLFRAAVVRPVLLLRVEAVRALVDLRAVVVRPVLLLRAAALLRAEVADLARAVVLRDLPAVVERLRLVVLAFRPAAGRLAVRVVVRRLVVVRPVLPVLVGISGLLRVEPLSRPPDRRWPSGGRDPVPRVVRGVRVIPTLCGDNSRSPWPSTGHP